MPSMPPFPPAPADNDEGGLQQDIALIAQRRRVLGWIAGGSAVALLAACGGGSSSGSSSSSTSSTTSSSSSSSSDDSSSSSSSSGCLADPEETNGPYPADGSNTVNGSVVNVLGEDGIERSDIRSSFGTSTTTAPGVPLTLTIKLVNVDDSCALLSGYAIYVWHCNRDGEYSLYGSDILDENYLRGVQVTDDSGEVTFTTIYPACYSGRWPHIHFEVYPSLSVATSRSNAILTSQMAMPEDICDTVYAGATGYSASVTNLAKVSLSSDGVFNSSTTAQLAQQTPSLSGDVTDGYTGTITVGVAL